MASYPRVPNGRATPNRLCFPIVGGEVGQPPCATRTTMPRTIVIPFSKADVYTYARP